MSSSKVEDLCNLTSNYDFQIEGDIPEGVICSICCKLMADPYVAICGCQFCLKCLKGLLTEGRGRCNGKGSECIQECLDMDKTVFPDYRARVSIRRINVKCPYNPCSVVSELAKMEEHMLTCSMMPRNCPFKSLGCPHTIGTEESIDDHLLGSIGAHSELLIEGNSGSKTDINLLKQNLLIQGREINELKKECQNYQLEIDKLREENRNMEIKLKEDIEAIKGTMALNEEEMENMKAKIDIIVQEFKDGGSNIDSDKEHGRNIEARMKAYESNMKLARYDIARINSYILKRNVNHDFLWSIYDFSTKKGWIDSDVFWKDDYKLCLGACIGSKNFYLYFRTTKGDKDDVLQWPMMHIVTLSIINQHTMLAHKSDTYRYDGLDPTTTDKSSAFGVANRCFGAQIPPFSVPNSHFGDQNPHSSTFRCAGTNIANSFFGAPPHNINDNSAHHFGQTGNIPFVANRDKYNIWCLWISLSDIETIPGLLVNDCVMVCCYFDKRS